MLRTSRSTRTLSTTLVVPVEKVRRELGFSSTERDEDLVDMILAATQEIEEDFLWQCLINTACVDRFDTLVDMELHWSPVQSITSITYVDENSTTQTLSASVYELGHVNGIGVVREKYDQDFPTVRGHEDDVTVTYVAGYGTTVDSVPMRIRHAVSLKVRQLFRPGEDSTNEELAIRRLLMGRTSWRIT